MMKREVCTRARALKKKSKATTAAAQFTSYSREPLVAGLRQRVGR
jgi:hypothetical protein